MAQFAHRALRDAFARLARAQIPGRLRSEISPRPDALHRNRRHRRRCRRQRGSGRALHLLHHGPAGRLRGPAASPYRRRGGVLRPARQQAAFHHRASGRAVRNHPQGARSVLGAARRLSRPGQRGHRGGADVRHYRQQQAGDADLSAGTSAVQDQAAEGRRSRVDHQPEVWQMGSDGTAVSVCSLSPWGRAGARDRIDEVGHRQIVRPPPHPSPYGRGSRPSKLRVRAKDREHDR